MSTRKRSGKWEYRISYKDEAGKFREKSKGGFRTKRKAELAEAEFLANLEDNLKEDRKSELVDYFVTWAKIHKKPHLAVSTWDKYLYTIKKLREYFKHTKLVDVTDASYQRFINQLAERYAQQTITTIHKHMRQLTKYALHTGALKRDFAFLTVVKSQQKEKPEEDFYLEEAPFLDFSDHCLEKADIQSYFFCYLISKTGMRFSENQSMQPESFDFENLIVKVERTYKVYGKKKGWGPTKNKQSVRDIPIDQQTATAVRDYLQHVYVDNPERRLFTEVSNTAANNTAQRVAEQVAGKPIHVHGLRHSYASYLINNGIDAVTVSKILGHASVNVTLATYTHLFATKKERDFDKIRNLFEK